jgi:predicted NBD/HSP70 family sugar kinase
VSEQGLREVSTDTGIPVREVYTAEDVAPGLAERLGLPVLVDNDARAQALGEKWLGDGRGVGTFASVQTGEGLGVGLVLGGHLYRGDDGRTGELGHVGVVPDGDRCRCGLSGCWETIATLRWLRAEAAASGIARSSYVDCSALTQLSTNGDVVADELLDRYADNLAIGLAALVNLLGTRRFIVHGDVVGGGELMRAKVEAATRARVLGYLRADIVVQHSSLDTNAALLGAAGLVLSETFTLTV